jgi:hypothetical protein
VPLAVAGEGFPRLIGDFQPSDKPAGYGSGLPKKS